LAEVRKQSLNVIWGKSLSVARESASYLEGFTRVKQDNSLGLVLTPYGNNNRKVTTMSNRNKLKLKNGARLNTLWEQQQEEEEE
jgi:hypothetical protein